MVRTLYAVVVGLLVSTSAIALPQDGPIRITISADRDAHGFIDPDTKRRIDSAKDVRDALRRARGLELVDSEDEADIQVVVVAAAEEPTGEQSGSGVAVPAGDATVVATRSFERAAKTVRVLLSVDDHEVELVGRAGAFWRSAANDVAKQIREWVQDNSEALRDRVTVR